MLDEEYQKLLEYKIKGYSRVKIATKLNVTEFTVDKMIQKLKKKITKMLWKVYKNLTKQGSFFVRYLYRREINDIVIKHMLGYLLYFLEEKMDKEKLIEDIIEILEEDEKYIERPIVINIYLGSDE